jgi:DNA-directed RNA polymerase specialized sigma24 family protein
VPQAIADLLVLVSDIESAAEQMTELRRRRAAVVADLRAEGWSLQRIADAVGRTKQTIDQWARP